LGVVEASPFTTHELAGVLAHALIALIASRESRGTLMGIFAKFAETISVGTRICRRSAE
jgi:hypothetical protein